MHKFSFRSLFFLAISMVCLAPSFSEEEKAKKWDVQPKIKKSVSPASVDGVSGMVMAKIRIDVKGQVIKAEILKSTAPVLEEPVLTALKKWRFSPAELNGEAIECSIKVPFKFSG